MIARRRTVALLLAVALLAGCGEQLTGQEEAQEEWEAHTGAAWEEFAREYDAGWVAGCEAVSTRLRREERVLPVTGCRHPPSAADIVLPLNAPPPDPAGEGYELGLADGCEEAFGNAGRDSGACPLEPDE